MARLRREAGIAVLLVFVALCAACGSSVSTADTAAQQAAVSRQLAVAQVQIQQARQQLAAARARYLAERLAHGRLPATAIAMPAYATTAYATTAYATTAYATTASPQALSAEPSDLLAIERIIASVNAGFRRSVRAGIWRSEVANYWIGAGVYSYQACTAFEGDRGGGVVTDALVALPETLTPAPGWVDPVVGMMPAGRIYALTVDDIQTVMTTGQQRAVSSTIHATVDATGRARLLLRCS